MDARVNMEHLRRAIKEHSLLHVHERVDAAFRRHAKHRCMRILVCELHLLPEVPRGVFLVELVHKCTRKNRA